MWLKGIALHKVRILKHKVLLKLCQKLWAAKACLLALQLLPTMEEIPVKVG